MKNAKIINVLADDNKNIPMLVMSLPNETICEDSVLCTKNFTEIMSKTKFRNGVLIGGVTAIIGCGVVFATHLIKKTKKEKNK